MLIIVDDDDTDTDADLDIEIEKQIHNNKQQQQSRKTSEKKIKEQCLLPHSSATHPGSPCSHGPVSESHHEHSHLARRRRAR